MKCNNLQVSNIKGPNNTRKSWNPHEETSKSNKQTAAW